MIGTISIWPSLQEQWEKRADRMVFFLLEDGWYLILEYKSIQRLYLYKKMRKKYLPFWVDWNITQRKWLKCTEVLWRVPIMGLLQQVWPLGRTSACFYNFSAGEWRGFPIGWPWALTDHVGLVLNASMMLALTRHTGEAFQLSEMPRKKTLFSFVLLVSLNNMVVQCPYSTSKSWKASLCYLLLFISRY